MHNILFIYFQYKILYFFQFKENDSLQFLQYSVNNIMLLSANQAADIFFLFSSRRKYEASSQRRIQNPVKHLR